MYFNRYNYGLIKNSTMYVQPVTKTSCIAKLAIISYIMQFGKRDPTVCIHTKKTAESLCHYLMYAAALQFPFTSTKRFNPVPAK